MLTANHKCYVHDCEVDVIYHRVLCNPHWRRLRPETATALWRAYREQPDIPRFYSGDFCRLIADAMDELR